MKTFSGRCQLSRWWRRRVDIPWRPPWNWWRVDGRFVLVADWLFVRQDIISYLGGHQGHGRLSRGRKIQVNLLECLVDIVVHARRSQVHLLLVWTRQAFILLPRFWTLGGPDVNCRRLSPLSWRYWCDFDLCRRPAPGSRALARCEGQSFFSVCFMYLMARGRNYIFRIRGAFDQKLLVIIPQLMKLGFSRVFLNLVLLHPLPKPLLTCLSPLVIAWHFCFYSSQGSLECSIFFLKLVRFALSIICIALQNLNLIPRICLMWASQLVMSFVAPFFALTKAVDGVVIRRLLFQCFPMLINLLLVFTC